MGGQKYNIIYADPARSYRDKALTKTVRADHFLDVNLSMSKDFIPQEISDLLGKALQDGSDFGLSCGGIVTANREDTFKRKWMEANDERIRKVVAALQRPQEDGQEYRK